MIKIKRRSKTDLTGNIYDSSRVIKESIQPYNPDSSFSKKNDAINKNETSRIIKDSIMVNNYSPNQQNSTTYASVVNKLKPVNIEKGHAMLSHMGEESTRKTLKHIGYPITRGKLKP